MESILCPKDKKRPRPGTPWSGPLIPLAGLGSLLDPLTYERPNTRSLTLHRAVGGSGAPQLRGLRRRPATSPSACQAPKPDRLPSRRYPARWLTSLLCLRMAYAIVHTGRIRNALTVSNICGRTSRIICLRTSKNLSYGVRQCGLIGYTFLNRRPMFHDDRIVNK